MQCCFVRQEQFGLHAFQGIIARTAVDGVGAPRDPASGQHSSGQLCFTSPRRARRAGAFGTGSDTAQDDLDRSGRATTLEDHDSSLGDQRAIDRCAATWFVSTARQ
jgi:hypothetical protein